MKKYNQGFTLIELLVVIAIIGILSGIVLTSLGYARLRAKIASAQGSLSSIRSQAELSISNGLYPDTLCDTELVTLLNAVQAQTDVVPVCVQDSDTGSGDPSVGYAVLATMPSLVGDPTYYCVDNSGFAGEVTYDPDPTTVIAATSDAGADVSCLN